LARNWKNTSDGLIGLCGHTFDEYENIDTQFEVIRRSADVYIVRLYSWVNGRPSGLMPIGRKQLLGLKLNESCEAMNVAYREYNEQLTWKRLASLRPARRPMALH
jgi:hypothetical protein